MHLTEHFALDEFLQSQIAARSGVVLDPPPLVILNLKRLCVDVLEPMRNSLGKPITVTSGWRPEWLNKAIGGASGSAHLTGRASDIRVQGMPPVELAKYIRGRDFAVDKAILEFPDASGGGWVHVQVSEKAGIEPRKLFLTASHSEHGTVYSEGLLG